MSSLFDFDNSQDLVFQAKTAGKQIISAKHEALTKLGAFLFLAHSDNEFALRCQMFDNDITAIANRRLATVSDSKGKLVRALHAEWTIRHATCKCADGMVTPAPNLTSQHDMGGRSHADTPGASGSGSMPNLADYTKKFNQDTTAGERANSDAQSNKGQGGLWNDIKGVGDSIKGIADNVAQDARTIGNDTLHALAPRLMKPFGLGNNAPLSGITNSISKGMENAGKNTNGPGGTNVNQGLQNPFDINKTSNTDSSKEASKGDQDTCAECGAPATVKDVRGYLELCDKCAGNKKASVDNLKEADVLNSCPSCSGSGCPECSSGMNQPMNSNDTTEPGVRSVPGMTAGIKSAHSSCDCGEEAIGNFNGQPKCLPGMGCSSNAQQGSCPGCNQSFHGFNVCPGGNCQGNPEEDAIMQEVMKLRKEIEDVVGNGESLETVKRHDEGHDDWHRSMGQEPCTSEEDCAAKAQEHEAMEHEQHTSKKKKKEDHYKYIKKQGDSWVVTQKGTGKVLSHHDSKEKAIASFKAMMMNKHG